MVKTTIKWIGQTAIVSLKKWINHALLQVEFYLLRLELSARWCPVCQTRETFEGGICFYCGGKGYVTPGAPFGTLPPQLAQTTWDEIPRD